MVKGNMISKQVHIKTETMEIGNIPWGKIIEKHTRYWVSITLTYVHLSPSEVGVRDSIPQ